MKQAIKRRVKASNLSAVEVIDGKEARLEVSYCIPDLESDFNVFTEVIGGKNGLSTRQACMACFIQARAWAKTMRDENRDFGAWDKYGNTY